MIISDASTPMQHLQPEPNKVHNRSAPNLLPNRVHPVPSVTHKKDKKVSNKRLRVLCLHYQCDSGGCMGYIVD